MPLFVFDHTAHISIVVSTSNWPIQMAALFRQTKLPLTEFLNISLCHLAMVSVCGAGARLETRPFLMTNGKVILFLIFTISLSCLVIESSQPIIRVIHWTSDGGICAE